MRSPLVRPSSGQNTLSRLESSSPPGMRPFYPRRRIGTTAWLDRSEGCEAGSTILPHHRGVAQLGSARRLGRRGRRFESGRPDRRGPNDLDRLGTRAMSDLLERNVLVIDQKPKLIELTNEYRILDDAGNEVGVIREEGQSKAKKVFRFFSDVDQFLTHRLAVYDREGAKVLELLRPAKIFKSTLQVSDDQGRSAGKIVQENFMGKKRFRLEGPGGDALGSINAENWMSWDFAIHDPDGNEVGRITKNWRGVLSEA